MIGSLAMSRAVHSILGFLGSVLSKASTSDASALFRIPNMLIEIKFYIASASDHVSIERVDSEKRN
jgi:hypothetical protein